MRLSGGFAEGDVETAAMSALGKLGYETVHGVAIAPDGPNPERISFGEVLLRRRLLDALQRLNPHLAKDAFDAALSRVESAESQQLVDENRRLHKALVDGVEVEAEREDGSIGGEIVRLIDFDEPANNDWLAVNQFTVIEDGRDRRPDIVLLVNGLPLIVIELKNPGDANATLDGAYNQIQTYKTDIPSLFRTNLALVTSDGVAARMGSLTAGEDRFMPWRTRNGETVEPRGWPELDTLLAGAFERGNLLDYLKGFVVFESDGARLIKKIAGYHQFHAVRKAVRETVAASAADGDRKIGVVWHTQGSGKSLSMVFYAGQVIAHPAMENPTLLLITDRTDLDDQLFGTFSGCKDLLRQTPVKAESRAELRELLSVVSGGVIFTTIQKFSPDEGDAHPLLTDRRNVVVIADEAHRTQYGFEAKLHREKGTLAYGFAKYLRDAIPNASFIGFTGTPVELVNANTRAVFGDYIDTYDISRAVEDGATVPIYYESRLARVGLDEEEIPKIDAEIEQLAEDLDEEAREKSKGRWAQVEALVGAEKRLKLVAADIVEHFERRLDGLDGKGMIVCMSRAICVALYNEIVALRPQWHDKDDARGAIKIVMTGSASDPQDWQPHIRGKGRREALADRLRNPDDPLKLVIVRDMWLTGFDAPCLHTMYVDKPMRGHGLMQAIARVNRVFRDKPGGLIVDYIGIAQRMKEALRHFTAADQAQTGIDEDEAVAAMLECHERVRDMYDGFDYRTGLEGEPMERLRTIAQAIEWIMELQRRKAEAASSQDDKKKAWRGYADAVLALSKAFALASASEEARNIREEVGFFQTVRAAMAKNSAKPGKSRQEVNLAVQQIVSRAVVSTEIVDILKAAGIDTPNISVLSEEFLAEVRQMEAKNLALEALRKLLNGEIRSQTRTNVVQFRAFSERLLEAVNKYHSNALTTVQVLEELLALARDVRDAHRRGEEQNLTPEEVAFYDALADHETALEAMGEDSLRVIATDLVEHVRGSVSVDWNRSEAARARIRVLVKRILKKHGYPPDLQDSAVQTVLAQAERLSAEWAV